ncbi:MAG: winged helix-turn-helix transcriptional regulator [Clostridiales bacterium]|nr:winged helix-turn-helix transcriptional regulator [Candidatus Blautia equi]
MDQNQHAGYAIHTLHRMFGRRLGMLFEEHGISQTQSWIIKYLYDHREEAVYQKDIEAFFRIARSTATGVLQCMEKQGYLTRCSVEGDARLKRLVLTEKAIAIQMAVFRILEENEQTLRQDISEEELEVFFRVTEKMKANIMHCSDNEP